MYLVRTSDCQRSMNQLSKKHKEVDNSKISRLGTKLEANVGRKETQSNSMIK